MLKIIYCHSKVELQCCSKIWRFEIASGGGFFARNSKRVSRIENSTIVDGGLTDRYNIRPLDVQNSETVRINDYII